MVGLSTKLNDYPDELSGGEQQRVSLARAFVNQPPLLLADEPTGNLDPETSLGIMQLIYRINRAGTTVIVATHDSEMVDRMRRRVIEMNEGRVVRDEAGGAGTAAMRPFFFLREALRALRRNAAPSLAAFATILITTLVLGVFIPVVRAATAKTNEVRNKIELEVFINDDATRAEVRELGNMISDIRHVESIDYISKAEALRILRKRLGDKSSITEDLPGNPLPRSYRIKLDDPQNADLVKSSLQPVGDERRAALHQPRDPGDQGPRGRHREDPLGHQHDKDPARFARRPAGARLRAAGRQHDPAVDLRPPARGRGDAAGRRDELVHPLAVRDRGPAGRLLRRPRRGRAAVAGEGDGGGSAGRTASR